jgi:hypothetical protein
MTTVVLAFKRGNQWFIKLLTRVDMNALQVVTSGACYCLLFLFRRGTLRIAQLLNLST